MVSEYGNIQNAFTKEGAGVSFFFFWGGGGGEGGGAIFPWSRFIEAMKFPYTCTLYGCPSVTLRSTKLPSFSF